MILEAIHTVLKGEFYISNTCAKAISENLTKPTNVSHPFEKLTKREKEIFNLLGQGLSRKQIACDLSISIHTVETHIERIKKKTKITENQQLSFLAFQQNQSQGHEMGLVL